MQIYTSKFINVYDTGETVAFTFGCPDDFRRADVRESLDAVKQKGYWEELTKQYPRMADVFECMLEDTPKVSRLIFNPYAV